MNNRWIASKFGLFNLAIMKIKQFNYRWKIFRGTNGSGKSVIITQSFIPLLLDG